MTQPMKKWSVAVPISGVIHVEVEAEAEEEAMEAAFNSEDLTLDNIEEWEAHRKIVQGNVCYALQWEIEVTEIDGD